MHGHMEWKEFSKADIAFSEKVCYAKNIKAPVAHWLSTEF